MSVEVCHGVRASRRSIDGTRDECNPLGQVRGVYWSLRKVIEEQFCRRRSERVKSERWYDGESIEPTLAVLGDNLGRAESSAG